MNVGHRPESRDVEILGVDGIRVVVSERIEELLREATDERLAHPAGTSARAGRSPILQILGRSIVALGTAIAGDESAAPAARGPVMVRDGGAALPPAAADLGPAGTPPCEGHEAAIRRAA